MSPRERKEEKNLQLKSMKMIYQRQMLFYTYQMPKQTLCTLKTH